MKRLLYILSMIMILGSCVEEHIVTPTVEQEDGKITVGFSVDIPEAQLETKAMGEKPQLENLYLAVFDEVGYLAEYVKATPVPATANGTSYKYTVTLSLSDTPRTIHWIGNAPESLQYGSEENVMMGIKTSGDKDAYWYRKVVDKVDAVSHNDGISPSPELIAALSNIPLVRNFARIHLIDNTDTFELESYAVVNTYKDAYTAGYDFSNGHFMDYLKSVDGNLVPKTYDELISEGYDASTPTGSQFVTLDEAWPKRVGVGQDYYVYEREKPVSSPAYIIAYGKYLGAEKKTYYKINLRDDDGNYFPIIRNFQVKISLNAVYRNGYATPAEAAASVGSGDVSTAIEVETITYISDGTASLDVEYTDVVTMSADPLYLDFKFYPDLDNPDLFENNNPNCTVVAVKNNDAGIAGEAIETVALDYTEPGNPRICITPTAPGDVPKSQSITIVATYEPELNKIRTLQRKVKLTVMNKQKMSVVCAPKEVPNLQGWAFSTDITIPAGLSRGMFPLDFKIESQNLSITPDLDKNQMSIETGKSVVNSSKPAYYFMRNLGWIEYQSLPNNDGVKTFSSYFKTTKAESETAIYVENGYFYGLSGEERETYASTSLGNYEPLYFAVNNGTTLPAGKDRAFEFSFTMTDTPSDNKVLLTMENAVKQDAEGKLELQSTSGGKNVYKYDVTGLSGTHTLKLITTGEADSPVTITLNAHHFIEETWTAVRID